MQRPLPLLGALAALMVIGGCGAGSGSSSDDGHEATLESAAGVPFDRAFIDAMIRHHAGAIATARRAKRLGLADPALVKVADEILFVQRAEIGLLRHWRKVWYGSMRVDPDASMQMGITHAGTRHVPLEAAGKKNIDAAFARAMITHHQGAVRIAKKALRNAHHEEIRDLARDIITKQQQEIAIMAAAR
jgi:uncharacterized protein (DUF305 family)